MKQLFTYILLALSFATANAEDWVVNAEPSILEVHYTRIEVTDTTRRDSRFLKEPVMLRIGKTMSLFCGTKKLWKDSLNAVNPALEFELYRQTMQDNRENGTHTLPGGYYWSYIYKNYPEGKVTERCYFDGERRLYEEDWEKPQWDVTDSVKTVLGYECFKATTDYRGRKWTAWFSPEIPVSEGPWKLCGLPGLILEAYDTNHDYTFTADALRQNGIPEVGYMTYDDKRGIKRCSRDKFMNDWWRYKNSDFAGKMSAMFGKGSKPSEENVSIAPLYDREETNYPHDL